MGTHQEEEDNSASRIWNHGRISVSHNPPNNNKENNTRKTSILPDLLRSVTLEEIIHAVDIVTEEEEKAKIGEEKDAPNLGILDNNKGPVFLQGLSSYIDETESHQDQ